MEAGVAEGEALVPALRAWVLGRFEIEVDGRLLNDGDWRGRRQANDLLAFLLTRSSQTALTEDVLEALWADRPLETAQQALYRSASQIRTLVGRDAARDAGPAILISSGHVSLNPRWPLWLDLEAFQNAVKQAQQSRAEEDCRAALALYGGMLLPDARYADWPNSRRHEVERERAWLLAQLGQHAEARHDMAAALELGQQLAGIEPWNERAHRRIMRAYAGLGRRAEALRHYYRLAARIEQELGSAPAPETQDLFDRLNVEQPPSPAAPDQTPSGSTAGQERVASSTSQQAPLVGRQQELALLAGLLADLPPGGSAAFLGGEPGIGKTRLAREVCRMAEARGLVVLFGAARAEPTRTPYAPVAEAIAGYLHARDRSAETAADPEDAEPREVAALLAGCEPLLRLVPEYADGPPSGEQISPEHEQRLIWHAAVTWLERVASDAGAVLFLDDLQWADEQTVALLRQVLLRLPDLPVLIVVTHREEGDARSPFGRLLAEAARHRLARRILLRRFDASEVAEQLQHLLGGQPSAALVTAIFERTNGNPLFVEGLADGLRHSGLLREQHDELHAAGNVRIPVELAESVRQRTQLLTPSARRVLEVGAVAGLHVDHLVLARASAVASDELLDALDQLRGARLLIDEGEGYTFQHGLVRDVVYDDLSVGRRMLLHRRVAEAIEQLAGPKHAELAGVLAHHWSRAGDAPLQAAEYGWRAGERARTLGALDEALASFNEALAQLDRAGTEGEAAALRRHEVLISLAKAQGMQGDHRAAHETLAQALALAPSGEPAAHVYRLLGDIDQRRGAYGAAAAMYRDGLAALGSSPTPERGRLLLSTAMCALRTSQHTEANALFVEARAALEAASERRDLGHAAHFAGSSAYYRGVLDEAQQWLERSLDLGRRANDMGGQSRALHALGQVFGARGHVERALPRYAEALELARRAGYPSEQVGALLGQSACTGLLGNWAGAVGAAEAALDVARGADLTGPMVDCHVRLAEVFVALNKREEATRQADLALARAKDHGAQASPIRLHTLLGNMHLLAGRHAEAIAHLRRAMAAGSEVPCSTDVTEAAGLLGAVLSADGDPEGDRWLGPALEQCRQSGYAPTACLIYLELAALYQRRSDRPRAEAAARQARSLIAQLGLPGITAFTDVLATAEMG